LKRILVTGAGGLLGSRLTDILSRKYEVVPTHNTQPTQARSVKMDISDRDVVFRTVSQISPAIVVHAGAATNVDRCETDRDWAWRVNVEGTRNVAEGCTRIGAKLIYVSTDYVFDGERGFYREGDKPKPVNNYGLTKLRGEEYVEEICGDHVIARTSVLYGWHPIKLNFATRVIDMLRNGREINVVSDHYNSPTFADVLADIILRLIEKDLKGVYHTSGSERMDRYSFALKIAETFGLDETLVKPVKMDDLKAWVARRPRDSSLCVEKAEGELQIDLPDVDESLNRMKRIQPAKFDAK